MSPYTSPSAAPRGLTFGMAAESYERFRPGYPDEVVERTLAFAGRDVKRAVEVGSGTGKATRAFASRNIHVTALEPDPDMFSVLRRETAGMPVVPVHTTFEAYAGPPTDLVFAAASWHWTDPGTRWGHTADLLVAGGVVAVFGSPLRIADPVVEAAATAAGAPTPVEATDPAPDRAGLAESGVFHDVEEHLLEREVVVSQRDYVGHLSTLSTFLDLRPDARHEALRRVASVLPAQVHLDLGVRLLLARRA